MLYLLSDFSVIPYPFGFGRVYEEKVRAPQEIRMVVKVFLVLALTRFWVTYI